jgi:transcriptional regulator with XRE-family HTH domain
MAEGEEMSLGETIRKAREEHGLTQFALASRVGVTASFITKVEKGEALPRAELLVALARVLDLPGHALLKMADATRVERAGERIRTRGGMFRQNFGVRGPSVPTSAASIEKTQPPTAEQLARMIQADRELQSAFEHLTTALGDPELRNVVLKMLETFARQAGQGPMVPAAGKRDARGKR